MNIFSASAREKRIFGVFLAVLTVYAGYAGVYRPVRARQAFWAARQRDARRQLAGRLRLVRRAAAQPLPEAAAAPDEQIMSGLLAEIGAVVGNKVRVREMTPQRAQKTAVSRRFAVTLTMEGSFSRLLRITHDLQSPPHAFLLDELTLEKRPGQGELTARLTVGRITAPEAESQ